MFNLSLFIKSLKEQRKKKKLQKKPQRSLARFIKKYPSYKMGDNCYGIPLVKHPYPGTTLTIGNYCSIAKNVQIFLGGNHRTDWVSMYPFPDYFNEAKDIKSYISTKGDVVIGSDVWLCENSTILSGVTVGHGAVIANGAIVTKDVAPYSIVAGNPAKHIRWRFDEATRISLLKSAWWDWPQEEILSIMPLLCSENIEAFLKYVDSREHK